MSVLNPNTGVVVAECRGCQGGRSTFEFQSDNKKFGEIKTDCTDRYQGSPQYISYILFRCAGCGEGALGVVAWWDHRDTYNYPGSNAQLRAFYPETVKTLLLPPDTPEGIKREFREAERCLANQCYRAAAGLFRSVLDKTMKANGYHGGGLRNLYQQIEAAATDGVITASRLRRAHDEIRVLGNDVLHDEWAPLTAEDVTLTHHYSQRILEDFYDDRSTIEPILRAAGRL